MADIIFKYIDKKESHNTFLNKTFKYKGSIFLGKIKGSVRLSKENIIEITISKVLANKLKGIIN